MMFFLLFRQVKLVVLVFLYEILILIGKISVNAEQYNTRPKK